MSSDGDDAEPPTSRVLPSNLRMRVFGTVLGIGGSSKTRSQNGPKSISTTPGMRGAGETETEAEADEPPRQLPTTRILPPTAPLVPPPTLNPLFEFCRLLSIVPAFLGTFYNLYHMVAANGTKGKGRVPHRVDFAVAALWSILTGMQCLCLTTGLLLRWRAYYTPLPTLIRLLALQAICWPATHFTLRLLGGPGSRPAATWALIGSTTSVSRAVQIWVTSNIMNSGMGGKGYGEEGEERVGVKVDREAKPSWKRYWRRWRGKRRWDWGEVRKKCLMPVAALYFVMAWADVFRREWSACTC